jgi:ankyrin repeat protein
MDMLWKACGYGDLAEVKRRVKQGGDVNIATADGFTGLMNAVLFDRPLVVDFLLSRGADLSRTHYKLNQRAVHFAAREGKLHYVKQFVAAGESLEGVDGGRLLGYATGAGSIDILSFLMESGVEISRRGDRGDSVWHCVQAPAIFEYLLETDAVDVIDAPNDDQETPLYQAAVAGRADLVALFLKRGANVNAVDAEEAPALARVAEMKSYDMVALLLDAGAATEFRTSYGATLESLAAADPALAQALEAYAARRAIQTVLQRVQMKEGAEQ